MEKNLGGENPKFDYAGLIADASMLVIGGLGGRAGNLLSGIYGFASAEGIKPTDYFQQPTYSTRPFISNR